jgi:ribosomal protein L37AE/L43A
VTFQQHHQGRATLKFYPKHSLESMGNTMLSFFVTMGDTMTGKYICKVCCSEAVAPARYNLGYHSCLKCGQVTAGKRKFTVVPMHKSNYVVISNKKELKGINNKGGFYE